MAKVNGVQFTDMSQGLWIDLGQGVIRKVEHFEDVLDRMKKGHFYARNIIGREVEAHNV